MEFKDMMFKMIVALATAILFGGFMGLIFASAAGCSSKTPPQSTISVEKKDGAYVPWWVEDQVPNGAGVVVK